MYAFLRATLIVLCFIFAHSQNPIPSSGETGQPKQGQTKSTKQPARPNQQGTEESPLFIKQIPTPKTQEEATRAAEERKEKAANDRNLVKFTLYLVIVTGILAGIGFFQLIVFGLQARRLRQTVEAASKQSDAMERSIAEAYRSASAMENIAEKIAMSTEAATASVSAINKQMRAYLFVLVGSGGVQNRASNCKFTASPILRNAGNTPAYKVSFKIKTAILPVPLPEDFTFPLPNEAIGGSPIGPHQDARLNASADDFCADEEVENIKIGGKGKTLYVWGIVTYQDVFGENHVTKFCHSVNFIRIGTEDRVTGFYIGRHEEID